MSIGVAVSGSRAEAEDLVQTALAAAYPKWRRIRREQALGYLRRSILNANISRWRRHRGREVTLVQAPAARSATDDVDERESLLPMLRTLPAGQRAVLVLRYLCDLPDAEIAATLRVSTVTVRSQASRGLATLRATHRPSLIREVSYMTDEIEEALRRELQAQWVPFDEARAEDMVRAATDAGLAGAPRAWVAPLAAAAAVVVVGGGVALATSGGGGNSGATGPGRPGGRPEHRLQRLRRRAVLPRRIGRRRGRHRVPGQRAAQRLDLRIGHAGDLHRRQRGIVRAGLAATAGERDRDGRPSTPDCGRVAGRDPGLRAGVERQTCRRASVRTGPSHIERSGSIVICEVGPAGATLGSDGCTTHRNAVICVSTGDCSTTKDASSSPDNAVVCVGEGTLEPLSTEPPTAAGSVPRNRRSSARPARCAAAGRP